MIYVDSSVLLAQIFDERRRPPPVFWDQPIFSSRLLAYEAWNRIHAYEQSHATAQAALVLSGIELLDLTAEVLVRALQPFPIPVRTLDGLHLATMDFLRQRRGSHVQLASYDVRLVEAAAAIGFSTAAI